MPRIWRALLGIVLLAAAAHVSPPANAQTVWSGFSYSFSKGNFANPTQEANQDRITSNVWLTRATNQGIFNANGETSYVAPGSPARTQWATDINNPGKTIAATNWSNLSFTNWVGAYGGQGSTSLPANLLSRNAVLYLVADNTYLDLRFTGWTVGGGGGFAYERSPAPPPPLTTGDYNLNGEVDAADYVVWRDTLTQSATPAGSGADGDANGTIGSGDYDFWRARFGNLAGAGLGSANVPEPSMLAHILMGLSAFRLLAKSRRSRS